MRTQLQLAAVWRVMALMLSAAPAVAQPPDSPVSITAFGGVAMAFGSHPATGVAIALKPHPGPVSLEFEYLRSRPDPLRKWVWHRVTGRQHPGAAVVAAVALPV